MNIDQITDIAWEVVNSLEPRFSYDIFDVSESQIMFQDERGLFKFCLPCAGTQSLKEQITHAHKRRSLEKDNLNHVEEK